MNKKLNDLVILVRGAGGPRGIKAHCHTISEKAGTISGGVLQAILEHFNG